MSEEQAILASMRFVAKTAESQSRPEEAEVIWGMVRWAESAIARQSSIVVYCLTLTWRMQDGDQSVRMQ